MAYMHHGQKRSNPLIVLFCGPLVHPVRSHVKPVLFSVLENPFYIILPSALRYSN